MELIRFDRARAGSSLSVVILVCALLWAGCAELRSTKVPKPVLEKAGNLPEKVAVLPFANRTPDPDAGDVVRRLFYNFFSSLNYRDEEPSIVDATLKREGMYDLLAAGKPVPLDRVGEVLGVDAVVLGEVTQFGKTYGLIYAGTSAGLKARMVRCRDGKRIWELEHKVKVDRGDIPISIAGLAITMIRSMISYQQARRVNAASRLCMEMVETIPNPKRLTEALPPKIEVLVHNGAERLLRPGQYLKAVLIGDPGHSAQWQISPLTGRMPLQEKEPGVYVGAYRVKPEDRVPCGRIYGFLGTEQQAESRWTDILGTVTLGEPTPLPRVISENTTLSAGKSPYLISDALLVKQGVTLKVEPGTLLWFKDLGMVIRGHIDAEGTAAAPVRFSGPGSASWKGIFMDRSQGENRFVYCDISNAQYGLRMTGSDINLDHSAFQQNGWGIIVDGGQAKLSHCLVRASEKTGVSARSSHLDIEQSIISENQGGGILLEGAQTKIENNNLFNNGQWDMKVMAGHIQVNAANNWWGQAAKPNIDGKAKSLPLLPEPITLHLFDRLAY
jgi:hypothetical protein